MKLTFNGTVIAAEPDFSGFDAILGFDPEASQSVQWSEPTRGTYQVPFARGNRKVMLTGTILPSPSATLGARLLAMESAFGSLPNTGDLTKQVGSQLITYPAAVLVSFKAVKDRVGITYGYELAFAVGAPTASTAGAGLQSQSGGTLLSQSGTPLEPQS